MTFGTLGEQMNEAEDYDGTYLVGTVIDISDPEGLERVKATIPGVYETSADCVWIGPAKKSPFGQGPGFGSFGVPALGSALLVELQHEDAQHPIYHGCIHMNTCKTGDLKSKFHKDAWGFKDPDGNELIVDMKAHTTTFTSQSQVKIVISAQGDISITTPKDTNLTVGGNLNATVAGETNVTSGGNVNIHGAVINLNGG